MIWFLLSHSQEIGLGWYSARFNRKGCHSTMSESPWYVSFSVSYDLLANLLCSPCRSDVWRRGWWMVNPWSPRRPGAQWGPQRGFLRGAHRGLRKGARWPPPPQGSPHRREDQAEAPPAAVPPDKVRQRGIEGGAITSCPLPFTYQLISCHNQLRGK